MTNRRTRRVEWTGSLCLAFAAAVSLPATVLVVGPILGRSNAIALHWVLVAVSYVVWSAPTIRKSIGAGAFVLLSGAGLLAAIGGGPGAPGTGWLIAVAVLVGLCRSVILQHVDPVRGWIAESVIGVGASLLAAFLAGTSIVAAMAAIWGFWLVQSLHALLPGLRMRGCAEGSVDPFERAMARLTGLLDDA